jgi:NADH-quinone oxidoreductase subunit L
MLDALSSISVLGSAVVIIPALLLAALGLPTLAGKPLSERTTSRLVQTAMVLGLFAAIGVLALMLISGTRHVTISLGNLVELPHHDLPPAHVTEPGAPTVEHAHFHFAIKFVFDRLSVPFVILTYLLCGTISAFASKYLHREPGFNRFFVLYALFALGMTMTSLAETIETLFTGWELVGVSSALLVAFFQERPWPVRNGLRVWSVYRISDAALLLAAVALHHMHGAGDFAAVLGAGPWPEGQASLTQSQALVVGLLLLIAAAGKSALIPFCGWLPRAMEGPTPSSAIFYGALSVHLGAFLLLRVSPILELSFWLCAAVVTLGLSTSILAALIGRTQTDIKSALAFASLTQVGLIVAEIGLGFRYLALVHILGHASLRTLQFLRASSLLQDYGMLENAIGTRLPTGTLVGSGLLPAALSRRLYRLALLRGHLDTLLDDYLVRPAVGLLQSCDRWERRWTDLLAGSQSRESDRVTPVAGSLEELS